ncbi:hypothetical protein HN51_005425 [Arachis hypogaea]|uniref:non-specific serine/threonine protein kinase n=3 Tax=Arachis TaxID=3817 RepID=A0A445DEP2_ARAHY|nr:CBL-interacting serine/threonine-protein kinase 14 [Arachis duranensis]XP_025695763.1 CBL-interacting serine/threonine-protein kinase 14 [Arachis hypogaea]XP_057754536.1 CBL-interacting serine/threonine-protein kinase 14-like [Arachis stenosperma]QHO39186.1 CBL-interacting serine/threonine-protein kinase [Arachis hypogaea]RYR61641.1 hypothetical protein Ahy_A04g018831 isoform A [Arachis hypogaea]
MSYSKNDAVVETEPTTPPTQNDSTVLFGKYELGELLGVGASAKVYHATRVADGGSVAVKAVSKRNIVSNCHAANVEREISVTRRLRHHPNIINLLEVLATKTKIYLVMEFAAGGELFQKVAHGGRLTEDVARKYFRQLISAVKHCHSAGVYHRDLKLDNLLLDDDGNLQVSDFGLSAVKNQIRPDGLLHTVCGTPAYVAPEILAKKGYNGATVDVWSCGVVLFALTAGFLPFNDYNITVLYRKIYRGQFRFPKWISCGLRNLISRLLDVNPETRITVDEIMQDPWFNSGGYKLNRVLVEEPEWEKSQIKIKTLNAFDLISFSTGLDMSGLFVNNGVLNHVERFVLREKVERILEKVDELAKGTNLTVTRNEKCEGARLEGQDGNLVALVLVYRLTDELVVVEVKSIGKMNCNPNFMSCLMDNGHNSLEF